MCRAQSQSESSLSIVSKDASEPWRSTARRQRRELTSAPHSLLFSLSAPLAACHASHCQSQLAMRLIVLRTAQLTRLVLAPPLLSRPPALPCRPRLPLRRLPPAASHLQHSFKTSAMTGKSDDQVISEFNGALAPPTCPPSPLLAAALARPSSPFSRCSLPLSQTDTLDPRRVRQHDGRRAARVARDGGLAVVGLEQAERRQGAPLSARSAHWKWLTHPVVVVPKRRSRRARRASATSRAARSSTFSSATRTRTPSSTPTRTCLTCAR